MKEGAIYSVYYAELRDIRSSSFECCEKKNYKIHNFLCRSSDNPVEEMSWQLNLEVTM